MAQHRDARRSDRAYLRTCEKRCFCRQASAIFEADGDAGSEVNPLPFFPSLVNPLLLSKSSSYDAGKW
jgi:hypothetical protein